MKVLMTGATGLIGRQLCAQLTHEGYAVTVLTRRVESAKGLACQSAHAWQPEQALPPMAALAGVEAVIHLAGEPVAQRWSAEIKRRIRDSRVLSTRNLVAAMRQLERPPKVLVSSSAVGLYGHRGDERLNEKAQAGEGFLSEVCAEWESEALKAESFGTRVALIRTGVVLDPAGGALKTMLPAFKAGIAGKLGDGRQWFPWIHRDDILGLLRWAMTNANVRGAFNGAAPNPVTNEEFTKELAAVLNRPALIPVPKFALNLLFGEMAAVMLASQRVEPQAVLSAGFTFRFPLLREALQDLFKS
jgi:uncharacterized protein